MAQLLSQVAVGSIVKLNESGSPVEFYVAKHDYESGLNGTGRTLLVRKDCYDNRVWYNGSVNAYASSDLDNWFNSTYKNMLDADIRSLIGTTKIRYTLGDGNNTVGNLERAVFALSATELGKSESWFNVEGSALPIASTLQVAYRNGSATTQWTRSPLTNYTSNAVYLNSYGDVNYNGCYSSHGSRPAFTLPGATTYVLDDGTITLNQPPTAPGSINVPTVAAGQPCAITWTAATDPDGTIASYTLERSVNGSGWTQVFSGNALTYTDTIGSDWGTIAYRVCAVDNYGMSGPYATSETQTVQDGILYISGPASAMGSKVAPFAFEISTGVSGPQAAVSDIAVEISLDGNQIYSSTVDTGEEISVTIDTRAIGGGSHTIEATASKTDYISASESYTFSTPSLSLPDGGLGVQLQDDQGRAVFPQGIAALIAGLGGKSVAGNLQDLIPAVADLTANQVRVETGSYVGTGGSGSGSPNSLTFGFEPKAISVSGATGSGANYPASVVWIRGGSVGTIVMQNGASQQVDASITISWQSNGIQWYTSRSEWQLNMSGHQYVYIVWG